MHEDKLVVQPRVCLHAFAPPIYLTQHTTLHLPNDGQQIKARCIQLSTRLTQSVTSTPFCQRRDADSGSPSPQTSPDLEDFNIHTLEYCRRHQLPSPLSANSQVGRINQSQRHDSLSCPSPRMTAKQSHVKYQK